MRYNARAEATADADDPAPDGEDNGDSSQGDGK